MLSTGPSSQVCLAGLKVCNDWSLIQALKLRHSVTLVEQVEMLTRGTLPDTTRVLVLDCTERAEEVLDLLPALKKRHPTTCILLVDGGLSQKQVAGAFAEGVCDYFPDPYDVHLLSERVSSLGARSLLTGTSELASEPRP